MVYKIPLQCALQRMSEEKDTNAMIVEIKSIAEKLFTDESKMEEIPVNLLLAIAKSVFIPENIHQKILKKLLKKAFS